METISAFFDVFGYISTVIVIAGAIFTLYLWSKGILPVLKNLGLGLASRKIAIFAQSDELMSLRKLLADSGLFMDSNIIEIASENDAGRAERASVFLVYWPDWGGHYKQFVSRLRDRNALIIYAPQDQGPVPVNVLKELNKHRHFVVCNFRGRLLNDILVSMITTGYDKKGS